jgi:GAF domain-containing protein
MLCLPIFGRSDPETGAQELIGVATLANKFFDPAKKTIDYAGFNEVDISKFQSFLSLVGMAITNAMLYESAKAAEEASVKLAAEHEQMCKKAMYESQRIKILLEFAMSLYKEDDLNNLNRKIILHARDLLNADRASVFLVDRERNEVSIS